MRYIALSKRRALGSQFSCSVIGVHFCSGRTRLPPLASILCKATVLGGSRRFLGFRLELLPRLRRLEGADVVQKPVGKRVGEVGYMTSRWGAWGLGPKSVTPLN